MAVKSLHSFCKEYNLAKSTTHNDCKTLGIDTSNGLSVEAQAQLVEYLKLDSKKSAKPVETDIVSSSGYGLGGLIPSADGGVIHLHIHTGDRDFFRSNVNSNRSDLAVMINGFFQSQGDQGLADGEEIEEMAQYIKTQGLKKRLEGIATGQQAAVGNE